MQTQTWSVHKFGGTCLADADRIMRASALVLHEAEQSGGNTAVVLSAMSGVTDELLRATDAAARREDAGAILEGIGARYREAARTLLADHAQTFLERLAQDLSLVRDVFEGIQATRRASCEQQDLVSGFGELWSAQLFCSLLVSKGRDATILAAQELLVVDKGHTGLSVDWSETRSRLDHELQELSTSLLVIPGFVACDHDGVPTTLDRNGSDFSASIFANLLSASSITIWTDVDGVMTADPRRVPEAAVLPELSYNEAMELAYFGASVLHPQTMAPAIQSQIPIRIRNAAKPEHPGTLIHKRKLPELRAGPLAAVKAFSSVEGITLLNLEGTGMIGVPGIAQRLFAALQEVNVSVILISQASSEHSICVAIPEQQAALAKKAVEQAFAAELVHERIQAVEVSGPYSILAAVGDNMVESPGVAARFFAALGKAGINVRAVAQGSSERNLSAVVAEEDSAKALRVVHAAFYLAEQTIALGIIGPGQVGSALLRQLEQQAELLAARKISFEVRGIMTSKRMLLKDKGIELASWPESLANEA